MRGAMPHAQPMADLVDQSREDKTQRFEQHDGVIQFHCFFEAQGLLVRIHRPDGCAASQRVQTDAVLSESFRYPDRRQCGEISERMQAPSRHRIEKMQLRRQKSEWYGCKLPVFHAAG